LTYWTKRQKR